MSELRLDQLSEQIDWCPRCNEFLAWDRNGVDTRDSSGEGATVATPTIAPPAQATGTRGRVVLRLRGPGEETTSDLPVQLSVEAGHTVSLTALVRNESEIVEHFRVSVDGLPDGWWSVEREVVRLMSFGSGEYEKELRSRSTRRGRRTRAPGAGSSRSWRAPSRSRSRRGRRPGWTSCRSRRSSSPYARPWRPAGGGRGSTPTSRNVGNTPVAVDVGASELEDRCRFVLPAVSTGIVPGQTAAIPIGVRPRRPLIIGRKADRLLELRAWTADDEPGPAVSRSAIYRQRPWIPWWLALLVVLLVIAAVLVFLLWPDRVTVPDVEGEPSAFAAQERLEEEGLTVSPDSKNEVRTDVEPGTVIGQTPAAGTEVDPGTMVTLLLARGARGTRVPDVRGSLRARPTSASSQRTSRSGPSLRSSIRRERSRARSRCPAACADGARPSTSSSPARR